MVRTHALTQKTRNNVLITKYFGCVLISTQKVTIVQCNKFSPLTLCKLANWQYYLNVYALLYKSITSQFNIATPLWKKHYTFYIELKINICHVYTLNKREYHFIDYNGESIAEV